MSGMEIWEVLCAAIPYLVMSHNKIFNFDNRRKEEVFNCFLGRQEILQASRTYK